MGDGENVEIFEEIVTGKYAVCGRKLRVDEDVFQDMTGTIIWSLKRKCFVLENLYILYLKKIRGGLFRLGLRRHRLKHEWSCSR